MTIIAAIKDGNKIYMGGDSIGANPWSYSIRNEPKVFIKDELIIGYAGSFRLGQLVQYAFEIPAKRENCNDYKYMICDFVTSLKTCLRDNGCMIKEKEQELIENEGCLLIGYRGNLYELSSDWQIATCPEGVGAIGSGYLVALGVLFADDKTAPEIRLGKSLEISKRLIHTTRSPFTIISKEF